MARRLLIIACACLSIPAFADDKKGAGPPQFSKEEMAAMEKMMKHATPGEPHKLFERLAGKWDYTGKWWMSPDKTPMEMHGKSEGKVILDGRFYTETAKSTDANLPFEGHAWWGYDNAKKKYQFTWIDTMTSSISSGEGTFDAKTSTMTWHSEMYDAGHDETVKTKEVTVVKPDSIVKTFYEVKDGKDIKTMELNYTRAK